MVGPTTVGARMGEVSAVGAMLNCSRVEGFEVVTWKG